MISSNNTNIKLKQMTMSTVNEEGTGSNPNNSGFKRKRVSWNEEELEDLARNIRPKQAKQIKTNCPPATEVNGMDASLRQRLARREASANRILLLSNVSESTHISKVQERLEKALSKEGILYFDNPFEKCFRRRDGSNIIELEFINADMASRALCLHNYTQLHSGFQQGSPIYFTRPFDYDTIRHDKARHPTSWQGYCSGNNKSLMKQYVKREHQARVICIRGFPMGTSYHLIHDTLTKFVRENKLTARPGNPIVACKVKQPCAFVTFRTVEEANACSQQGTLDMRGITLYMSGAKVDTSPTKYNPARRHDIPSIGIKKSVSVRSDTGAVDKPAKCNKASTREDDELIEARKIKLEQAMTRLKLELQKATDSHGFLEAQFEKAKRDQAETNEKLEVARLDNSKVRLLISAKKKQLNVAGTSLVDEKKKYDKIGNMMKRKLSSARNELKIVGEKLIEAKQTLIDVRVPRRRVSLVPSHAYDKMLKTDKDGFSLATRDLQQTVGMFDDGIMNVGAVVKPDETYPIKMIENHRICWEI